MMKPSYKWCLFNLNNKYFREINTELKNMGYSKIKAYIPTVSILKKRQKGKTIYEDVPILFHYGFIKIPTHLAYSRPFLNKLAKDINGIGSWVKSNTSMHTKRLKKRVDSPDFDDFSIVATVPSSEVRRFRKLAKENKVYQTDEIVNLQIGSYVVLRGYPFNGIDATVKAINLNTKIVTLLLYPNNGKMEVKLPLDNVVYSIYHNFDEDKLFCNSTEVDTSKILAEVIDNELTKKQF